MARGALEGLVVVEMTGRVAGEYAARLLADFGATTVKVEPPTGSPVRAMGPFDGADSLLFAWLNTNKRSVVIDPAQAHGKVLLDRLLARADALITDFTPEAAQAAGIDPARVAHDHPHLAHCTITPFGWSAPGPWQNLAPINVINASGWAWHSPSEAAPDSPPLQGPGPHLAEYEAGLEAALATAASLWRKRHTGMGQHIDISAVATLLSRADCVLGRMLAGEQEPGPERTRYDMGGPGQVFACADGHVFLVMTTRTHWLGLCRLMGDPDWAREFPDDWLEFGCTPDRVASFRGQFALWIAARPRIATSRDAQQLGVALVEVNRPEDLPGHAQYQHRGYFQTLGARRHPTVPYRLSASPVRLASPAPAVGADQEWLI